MSGTQIPKATGATMTVQEIQNLLTQVQVLQSNVCEAANRAERARHDAAQAVKELESAKVQVTDLLTTLSVACQKASV